MRVMRLRHHGEGDFRQAAETQFKDLLKARRVTNAHDVDRDIVVLRSKTGKQFRVLNGFRTMTGTDGRTSTVFEFRQYNIGRGTWDDARIGDYTESIGIKLEGIHTLREMFATLEKAFMQSLANVRMPGRR